MNLSGNGNPSPTIKEIRQAIIDQMNIFATPRGGTVHGMQNEAHLWEYLYNRDLLDENPRILVVCRGEKARGEYGGGAATKLERVNRIWGVVIMRGHGFRDVNQEQRGQPGTPGFYEDFDDSTETVRDGIRIMSDITVEDVVDYKGWRPLASVAPTPAANVFCDCRIVEFETAADIPSIASMQRTT